MHPFLGHLPPNLHACIRAWNREYNQLIRKFAHIISGQFNGHTSTDSFTIFYSEYDNNSIPLNVAWNGGSASSYIQVNPNYRLYTVEPKTFEVIDFDTYIFNLTAANLTPDQPPKWFKEYSFREAFGVDDLSPYSLSKLANVTWRNDKKSLYKVGSTLIEPFLIENVVNLKLICLFIFVQLRDRCGRIPTKCPTWDWQKDVTTYA